MGRLPLEEKNKRIELLKNVLQINGKTTFSTADMWKIINLCAEEKIIPKNTDIASFTAFLTNNNIIYDDVFVNDRGANKFVLKNLTLYELALTVNNKAYLSHYTAVSLNNLTNNILKAIYVSIEQPKKNTARGTLTQAGILKAMNTAPRISKNTSVFKDYVFNFLQSKFSNWLGIEEIKHNNSSLYVTNLERTLIDITVSPYYCGGIYEVLSAYKAAKKRVDVEKMANMLKKLDYTYPYHQPMGFLMEKAGYKEEALKIFEKFEQRFKFFLVRELPLSERDFNERWKLFYPKFL